MSEAGVLLEGELELLDSEDAVPEDDPDPLLDEDSALLSLLLSVFPLGFEEPFA